MQTHTTQHNTTKSTTLYWNKGQNAISLQNLDKLLSLECVPWFSFHFFPPTHPVFFSDFILSFPMGLELTWTPGGIPLRVWLRFFRDIDVAVLRTHLVRLEHYQMYPLTMNRARRIPVSSEYSVRLLWDPWYPKWGWLTRCSFDSLLCDSRGLRGHILGTIRDSLPTYQLCGLLLNSRSNLCQLIHAMMITFDYTWMNGIYICKLRLLCDWLFVVLDPSRLGKLPAGTSAC